VITLAEMVFEKIGSFVLSRYGRVTCNDYCVGQWGIFRVWIIELRQLMMMIHCWTLCIRTLSRMLSSLSSCLLCMLVIQ